MLYRLSNSIFDYIMPDFSPIERKKFSLLSVIFFLIIGTFWIMHVLKDTMLFKVAFPEHFGWEPGYGRLMQPIARFWSPFIVFFVVIIYSKLVDIFKKDQLFYIICSVYSLIFFGIAALLGVRMVYGDAALGKDVLAYVGFISYFATESFSSLVITLFWSFAASISTTNEAKKGFALVIAGGQIGAILGSLLTLYAKQIGGIGKLYLIAASLLFLIMGMIWVFMRVIPHDQLIGNVQAAKTEEKKGNFLSGFFSGIVLLLTRPYLMGVFLVSTLYDVAAQVVDYQLKAQVDMYPAFAGELGFSYFQGLYGLTVNLVAFLIALFGTRYIIKRFDIGIALLIYPVLFGMSLISLYLFFQYGSPSVGQLLWATCIVMVIIKSLSYALNNPVKDMMYIPTSKDAKFKSKGWIDMFGGRLAKMSGARISNTFKYDLIGLMQYGTLLSMGLIGVWIIAALYVSKKNAVLVRTGTIIE